MLNNAITAISLGTVLLATAPEVSAEKTRTIGQVTALIAEASTADDPTERRNGQSGDTAFPYLSAAKPLATVGEVDAATGKALTGYPDGHAAWLADPETLRIAYQSESYGPMSNETYGWDMQSGVTFTGSHIHTIDYDRAGLANFLSNDAPASAIVKGSGHLFDRVFNVFGDEVRPKSKGGVWGNQALPDGSLVDFAPRMQLTKGDFFFHSFCGAFYEPAEKYGAGVGFADDIWLTAEEWNIQRMFTGTNGDRLLDTNDTMGLASVVVDIKAGIGYTAPALGQTGYEKLLPINPRHPDYVVIVLAGYNHDHEPAPLKVYVGKKGVDAAGNPVGAEASGRDRFLARNGLLYGQIYGMALANEAYARLGIDRIDPTAKMFDAYLTNPDAPDTVDVTFFPTSYRWGGWDAPVAVSDTEMFNWQSRDEQPEGHTFFNGDSKTEHPAVDPDVANQRWVQNMTHSGGLVGLTLGNFVARIATAGGGLPTSFDATLTRTIAAVDNALTLDVGGKGVKHGGGGTHATWEDGSARLVAPDGMQWIKGSDADVLILDEDSGNDYGERKFALPIDPLTLSLLRPGTGWFLAMAGGKRNPRAAAGASAYGGTFEKANSSEFSGSWNITALLARKSDGTFYTADELAGAGQQRINAMIPINAHKLIGVVQHRGESGGAVAANGADQGGQLFMFQLNLPPDAIDTE